MSRRNFLRRSRNRLSTDDLRTTLHRATLGDQPDVPLPNVHYVDRTRTPSRDVLLHVPASSSNQYVNRDAAVRIRNSTFETAEHSGEQPRKKPSISLTPSDNQLPSHDAPPSFHTVFSNPVGTALNDDPPIPPRSNDGLASEYQRYQAPRRRGSRSTSRASIAQQRSLSPGTASRRDGMIELPNFDGAFERYHSGVATGNAEHNADKVAVEKGRQYRFDSAVNGTDFNPAQHSQAVHNVSIPSPGIAPGRTHETSDLRQSSDTNQDRVHHSELETNDDTQASNITVGRNGFPIGRWRCCECRRGHEIYRFEAGQHLISILSCLCKHRSCRSCTFQGDLRRFAPINDDEGVAFVPVPEGNSKDVLFGVVCRTCGLSWRAKAVHEAKHKRKMSSLRHKLSVLPKKVNPLQKLRHTQSMMHLGFTRDSRPEVSELGNALTKSRSNVNLRSAASAQAKDETPEEQVEGIEVQFYGIECTCGTVTDASSICFQILEPSEADSKAKKAKPKGHVSAENPQVAELQSDPELHAKGHGTSMLHLKGGSHPNPLLSNPVGESDALPGQM